MKTFILENYGIKILKKNFLVSMKSDVFTKKILLPLYHVFFKSSIVFNFDFVLNFIQESILIKEKKETSSFNVNSNLQQKIESEKKMRV